MGRKVRVMTADDEQHVRSLLGVVCSSISGIELVAEAQDGEEAVEKFKETLPDLCLLDINMPKLTGVEALRQIKEVDPEAIVVMLTSLNSIDVVRECIEAGAKSYILKSNSPEKIRDAIKQISFEKLRKITEA